MASTQTSNEYDYVEKPSEDYFCPVTFELLKDPRQTSSCCGHHLSRVAAEQLEAEGKPCPLCQKSPLKTTEDIFFKRKVLQLKIHCSNKPQGCQWVGELGDLDRHLKLVSVDGECRFVEVECPLKCDNYIKRCELEEHQSNKCLERPFTCEYCNYKSTYKGVTANHWPKCQRYPLMCPNKCMEKKIERRFLQHHLKEGCPLQEIECKFSYAGCEVKVKRSMMKEHFNNSKDEHLCQLAEYGKTMKAELETVAEVGKNTRAQLEALTFAFSKFISKPFFVPPPEIILENFDQHKKEKTIWHSYPFSTHIGGYKICMGIDANGQKSGSGTHVSVFIYMMKGEFDSHLQWPFRGAITVLLVNQKEGKTVEHRRASMDVCLSRCTECDRSKSGMGKSKFIPHTDLYKPEEGKEYLKNDTLKLRVTNIVVNSV